MPDIVVIYRVMVEVVDKFREKFKMFDCLRLTKSSAYEFFQFIILKDSILRSVYFHKSIQVRAFVGFLDLAFTVKTIKCLLYFVGLAPQNFVG